MDTKPVRFAAVSEYTTYIHIRCTKNKDLKQLRLEDQQVVTFKVEELAHGQREVVAEALGRLGQSLLQRSSLPRLVYLGGKGGEGRRGV